MGHAVLQVKVKPGSRLSKLEPLGANQWLAHLRAPPVDGKANIELIALVAGHFGCARSAVTIKSGAAGRIKLVQVRTA